MTEWKMPKSPRIPDVLAWVVVAISTTVIGYVLEHVFKKQKDDDSLRKM